MILSWLGGWFGVEQIQVPSPDSLRLWEEQVRRLAAENRQASLELEREMNELLEADAAAANAEA